MKKLLAMLGAAGLVVSTSAVLVSCGGEKDKPENSEHRAIIDAAILAMPKNIEIPFEGDTKKIVENTLKEIKEVAAANPVVKIDGEVANVALSSGEIKGNTTIALIYESDPQAKDKEVVAKAEAAMPKTMVIPFEADAKTHVETELNKITEVKAANPVVSIADKTASVIISSGEINKTMKITLTDGVDPQAKDKEVVAKAEAAMPKTMEIPFEADAKTHVETELNKITEVKAANPVVSITDKTASVIISSGEINKTMKITLTDGVDPQAKDKEVVAKAEAAMPKTMEIPFEADAKTHVETELNKITEVKAANPVVSITDKIASVIISSGEINKTMKITLTDGVDPQAKDKEVVAKAEAAMPKTMEIPFEADAKTHVETELNKITEVKAANPVVSITDKIASVIISSGEINKTMKITLTDGVDPQAKDKEVVAKAEAAMPKTMEIPFEADAKTHVETELNKITEVKAANPVVSITDKIASVIISSGEINKTMKITLTDGVDPQAKDKEVVAKAEAAMPKTMEIPFEADAKTHVETELNKITEVKAANPVVSITDKIASVIISSGEINKTMKITLTDGVDPQAKDKEVVSVAKQLIDSIKTMEIPFNEQGDISAYVTSQLPETVDVNINVSIEGDIATISIKSGAIEDASYITLILLEESDGTPKNQF